MDATLTAAAGEYRLTLVTSAGGEPVAARGTLRLVPNEPALRTLAGAGDTTGSSVSAPLYGWAKIDLAVVGALELGSVGSQDPQRPGVLVLEQRPHAAAAPPTITLRLGSLANRRSPAPIRRWLYGAVRPSSGEHDQLLRYLGQRRVHIPSRRPLLCNTDARPTEPPKPRRLDA